MTRSTPQPQPDRRAAVRAVQGDWTADPDIAAAAKVNSFENFMIVFAKKFLTTVFARMDANTDIFKAINDDKAFADDLKTSYGKDLYDQFRAA